MAADDVAQAVAKVAVGSPVNGIVEVAGPELFRLDDLVREASARATIRVRSSPILTHGTTTPNCTYAPSSPATVPSWVRPTMRTGSATPRSSNNRVIVPPWLPRWEYV